MAAGSMMRVLRAQTTRWVGSLLLALTVVLSSSVSVALRAGDVTIQQDGDGGVPYTALGNMGEVRFEAGSGPAPVVDLQEPRDRETTRPVTDDDDDRRKDDDRRDDDGDDGDERDEPDSLVVTTAADRTQAAQGDRIAYTFTVTNVSREQIQGIIVDLHVPGGTYPAGACNGLSDESTLQPPVCADVPGLPATGSDDYHVLRALDPLEPGERATWHLYVRVGADTPDGATVVNHARAHVGAERFTSEDVRVTVT